MIQKCILVLISLSMALVSGCYAPRATRKLEGQEIYTHRLKRGDWVRIGYRITENKLKWQKGTVIEIRNAEIVLQERQSQIKIPKDRIVRIDFLEKKFNPGGTIVLATGLGMIILLGVGISSGLQFPFE